MLNLSPSNLEDNGDNPDVIVESASEDDEVDISQFVESVLEEPADQTPFIQGNRSPATPPPLIYQPVHGIRKAQSSGIILANHVVTNIPQTTHPMISVATGPLQRLPVLVPNSSRSVHRPGPASRTRPIPVRTVPIRFGPGPASRTQVYNGRNFIVPNPVVSNVTWIRDCFTKIKNSSLTLNYQVKRLEDRFKALHTHADKRKIEGLATDLQSLLRQTELGYKYLGSELASAQQTWLQKLSQRREIENRNAIRNSNILVRRQVLLPVSPERRGLAPIHSDSMGGVSLPPNLLISVNGNNHSLSITFEQDQAKNSMSELCEQYDIKPCYVLLERCDATVDTDNDDIQIIEELIAL